MSKKNNKKSKAEARSFDAEREKRDAEAKALKAKKKELKAAQGDVKAKKSKGIRIRKGLVVKGIKVKDSETKKKVKQILKKRAAAAMQIDQMPAVKKMNKSAQQDGATPMDV